MQDDLLPLFPLEVVLLPRAELRLHIFEERYKEMIGEAIRDQSEFGVVLTSGNGILNAGCTATVEQVVRQYPDGRMDIITRGLRRFEIFSIDDERSFLRAAIRFYEDEEAAASVDLRQRAFEAWRLAREPEPADEEPDPAVDAPQLSFLLARDIADLTFRQQLLVSRSETERLRRLVEFFPGQRERRERTDHVRAVAPTNGHTRWPVS